MRRGTWARVKMGSRDRDGDRSRTGTGQEWDRWHGMSKSLRVKAHMSVCVCQS